MYNKPYCQLLNLLIAKQQDHKLFDHLYRQDIVQNLNLFWVPVLDDHEYLLLGKILLRLCVAKSVSPDIHNVLDMILFEVDHFYTVFSIKNNDLNLIVIIIYVIYIYSNTYLDILFPVVFVWPYHRLLVLNIFDFHLVNDNSLYKLIRPSNFFSKY